MKTPSLTRSPRNRLAALFALVAPLAAAPVAVAQTGGVDPKLPDYQRTSGVSGEIRSVGSDTLANLMNKWSERFKDLYPQASFEMEAKGSGTAPVALINGTADLGPMSRRMKGEEVDKFEDAFGYEPTLVRTGIDAIAVFVHKDNPVERLTLDQLTQIYSVNGPDGITWGDIGVDDARFRDRTITLYGRASNSGTYGFFKSVGLGDADYKDGVNEQPGSSAVVQAVGRDQAGIGYSGIGYSVPGVKAVPIVGRDGRPHDPIDAEAVYSEQYPLARFLYVYVNKAPNEPMADVVGEFLKMVLSRDGQEAVASLGFFPLSEFIAAQEREKLGLELN